MKILIGYDGSTDASAAIDDLVHAGLPREVDALIVSVSDSPTVAVADIIMNADTHLRSIFPSWNVRGVILTGDPAAELVKKAEQTHADLIVVGSQGLSAISRLILGSVSLKVSAEARCSVRIGRHSARPIGHGQLRILIGLNCSASAETAIRKVLVRAWPEGTELRIVAVDDGVSTITTDSIIAANQLPGEYHSVVEGKFVKLAESRGLIVSAGIKKGEPEQVLIREAQEWEADCIVVGSRGKKTTSWGLFGKSVSAGLAANAPCSVEIIR
ncbi:MAG TPA: universal stress protein [Pyrinomonadaceae bacterium]|nr:universal stress protein [Pyrinomonadaceae bacterium]